jgi:hypothetical protein
MQQSRAIKSCFSNLPRSLHNSQSNYSELTFEHLLEVLTVNIPTLRPSKCGEVAAAVILLLIRATPFSTFLENPCTPIV